MAHQQKDYFEAMTKANVYNMLRKKVGYQIVSAVLEHSFWLKK